MWKQSRYQRKIVRGARDLINTSFYLPQKAKVNSSHIEDGEYFKPSDLSEAMRQKNTKPDGFLSLRKCKKCLQSITDCLTQRSKLVRDKGTCFFFAPTETFSLHGRFTETEHKWVSCQWAILCAMKREDKPIHGHIQASLLLRRIPRVQTLCLY